MEDSTELQDLKWQNKALIEALQYLLDTKKRKDTVGKDSIYEARKKVGWSKAQLLLNKLKRRNDEKAGNKSDS